MRKQLFCDNSFLIFVLLLVFLHSCSTAKFSAYNPEMKLKPEKLKEDLTLLKKILDANHPSLYWYTSKDSIDWYFAQTYNSINDSLTELQFRNKVAWFITKLRCGHTSVRPSKAYTRYVSAHASNLFPLLLKVWDDSMIVLNNLNRNDSTFKRGTIITSIEGIPNRILLDSMFQFISTDGYANNFKNQVVSFGFPIYYSFAFPIKDSFAIGYIDSMGKQQNTFVALYAAEANTSKNKKFVRDTVPPAYKDRKGMRLLSKRSITIDTTDHLAYMRLATFTRGKLRFFFKQSFQRLRNEGISNLVIDLRENSGGNISTSTNFSRYIKDEPFHIADTIAAINRSFTYGRYIYPSLLYRIAMRFTTRKRDDNKFHFIALENHLFKPYNNLHFDGNVYVLQGGYTFSAASMFLSNVKGQKNVTLMGEQTGGGSYGTSAVHLPDIELPYSKIQVVLPVYRIVSDSRQIKNGRGIEPDIFIPPSTQYIKKGVDYKLQVVKEIIHRKELQKDSIIK